MMSRIRLAQRSTLATALVFVSLLVMTGCIAPIAAAPVAVAHNATVEAEMPAHVAAEVDKIGNAMSAAPTSIAADAAIMDWPTEAGGSLTELRAGTNGWTCIPDRPGTPTDDPMCLDKQWMIWFNAYLTGSEPEISTVGVAYMLQGGSDADNDDPTLMEPAAGEEWMISPPHIMLLVPKDIDVSGFSSDHTNGGPWFMFRGTPYEHMMVPITEHDHHE